MSEVLQANIFFFVTGIAVIIFTFLLCVVLYHVIRILKSIRNVIDRVEAGSEVIAEDLAEIRDYFREGTFFSHLLSVFMGAKGFSSKMQHGEKKKKRKRKTLQVTDEE